MPKPLRLNVFIDEQNIIKAIRPQPVMLDVVRLATLLVDQCNHVGGAASYRLGDGRPIIVCVGAPPHSGAPDYSCHLVKRRIWSAVDSVRVVEGDLVWVKEEHRWKQDAVDVAMGVEAVLAAAGHECDAVVLATADRDLSYAAKTCEERLAPHDGRDRRPRVFTASIPPHKIPGFRHIAIPPGAANALDVSGLVAADEEAVLALYSFEDTDAQHVSQRTDGFVRWLVNAVNDLHDRQLLFVHEYLRAYWWWGAEVDAPFCRRLLDAWGNTATWEHLRPPEARSVHAALTGHLRAFARGYATLFRTDEPLAPAARCSAADAVVDALDAVRASVGRGGARASAGVRRARPVVSALLDVFCAQAYAARTVPLAAADRARADELYASAIGSFSGTGERSYLAWTHLHRGRLHAAGGSDADAASELRAARQVAVGLGRDSLWLRDYELIAAVDRTESELARRRGDGALAARLCAAAVFHALAFQVRPHQPDRYTQAVYDDVTRWATEQVGEDAAARAEVAAWWQGSWAAGVRAGGVGAAGVGAGGAGAGRLWPAGPAGRDLDRPGSSFAGRVASLVTAVEARVCPWGP